MPDKSMHNIIGGNPDLMESDSTEGFHDKIMYKTGTLLVEDTSTVEPILEKYNQANNRPLVERGTYDITSPVRRKIYSGGMLTGSQILEEIEDGHIRITPFDKSKINPNSFNLTLNKTLLVYKDNILDFKKDNPTNRIIIPETGLVLKPNTLYIGRTNERCWTDRFIPQLDGRSSIGRLGITIHVTAGYGDIGWDGTWTLEIMAIHPVRIYPNIEFCQISYHTPYGKTDIHYDGRYQGQIEPTASRSNLDKKVYV